MRRAILQTRNNGSLQLLSLQCLDARLILRLLRQQIAFIDIGNDLPLFYRIAFLDQQLYNTPRNLGIDIDLLRVGTPPDIRLCVLFAPASPRLPPLPAPLPKGSSSGDIC